jgi:hypothetical protein
MMGFARAQPILRSYEAALGPCARLNHGTGRSDQAIWSWPMSRFDKFAIAVVAFAVCGYFAWVHISCSRDPHCHINWCHKQRCGISYDKVP